jgi:hypothetical protein
MVDHYQMIRENNEFPEQLPIIPVVPGVAAENILPPWPRITASTETLVSDVMKRLDAVYFKVLQDQGVSRLKQLYLGPLRRAAMKTLQTKLLSLIGEARERSGL